MVFYLRQITLSIKSDDSVYAKHPLVKTSLLHPCREAPLGALTFRSLKKKVRFVHAKRALFLNDLLGLTPKAAAGQGMLQDFSRVFGKLLFRLRKTTTFGTANSKIILVCPKSLFRLRKTTTFGICSWHLFANLVLQAVP